MARQHFVYFLSVFSCSPTLVTDSGCGKRRVSDGMRMVPSAGVFEYLFPLGGPICEGTVAALLAMRHRGRALALPMHSLCLMLVDQDESS